MSTSPTFWKKIGVQDWFLKKETVFTETSSMTPDVVYKYIVEKFQASIAELSFADRVIFYHEYIICFSLPDYNKFMDNNKGIFALIIKESVKSFYEILQQHRQKGRKVTASANKWVFRFVSHPDYEKGDKSFIGKLLPGNQHQKEENLRVTFIPRQTGIAQTFDISDELLQDFTFYSDGYYEIPFDKNLVLDDSGAIVTPACFARLETTIPDKQYAGKKLEYLMKNEEIMVSGADETANDAAIFRVPSEWVSTPHLSIRYNKNADKFFLAAFGEKTLVNENEVKASSKAGPEWTELPLNSRIVLNGIVCINIFKF
ncbi:MAG TPA: hypothetical protein VK484_07925 [Ferruginibacter sp.]|nr:hypothetical protein [Ferruginibacter sp.]